MDEHAFDQGAVGPADGLSLPAHGLSEIDPDIRGFYDQGLEEERLTQQPTLELLRTRIILRRSLPPAPARVLDVGGGPGVHASWLASAGYRVHLVDPVPLHIEKASTLGGFTAALGDARWLAQADTSYDAVLLLGPLYHLVDRDDRIRALSEAARVVRSGGAVVAAAISRYASTFDGFFRNLVDEPGFTSMMLQDVRSGQHRNPEAEAERFTTAYFHRTGELEAEVRDAGLELESILPVEGLLHWAPDMAQRLSDPAHRQTVLDLLATMEQDPGVLAATAHLIAVATKS